MVETTIEREYKSLVTPRNYNRLKRLIPKRVRSESKSFIQLNYYYDSIDRCLGSENITLRIRQRDASLTLELKQTPISPSESRAYSKNIESSIEVGELPERFDALEYFPSVFQHSLEVYRLGVLVTERENWLWDDDILISLDRNFYLGFRDHELEIEFTDQTKQHKIEDFFRNLLPGEEKLVHSRLGKRLRFLNALDKL